MENEVPESLLNQMVQGDCYELLKLLPDASVDMVLADPPFGGVTHNQWDTDIDLPALWKELERVTKPNGAIVMFGQDKFSARLMLSNEKMHRYNLIWQKGTRSTGFLNAKKMPLRNHEDILVFYKKPPKYNPQFTKGKPSHSIGKVHGKKDDKQTNYGSFVKINAVMTEDKYPKSVLSFNPPHPKKHPTEKPVPLLRWLIETYTDEGETVLDVFAGIGSTGKGAMECGRKFVMFEKEEEYCEKFREFEEGKSGKA